MLAQLARQRRRQAHQVALLVAGQLSLISYLVIFLYEHRGLPLAVAAGLLAAVQRDGTVARVVAAELTFRAVDRLVQLTGLATGYLRTSPIPLERHFRDLRSASLNYANDRLVTASGALSLMDRSVRLI